nr:RRXRR domain-containing protein [Clostridium formicaceticum]
MVDLLSTRRQNRRTRRNRLRYRKVRFNNSVKRKKKGWLAPSIEHKIQSHFRIVAEIQKILPISKILTKHHLRLKALGCSIK